MSTYKEAGVDIEAGDRSSRLAYEAAKATFAGRSGFGSALMQDGGFTGAVDMGDYYMVQNDDGVGSKMVIAHDMAVYDTVGRDLVAMVADDAICVGAEVISLSNTVDIERVDEAVIGPMMEGLKTACLEQKIIVPGGEIAELPDQVKGVIWNATAVGVVEKDKFIDGSRVAAGDVVIGLPSDGFRSNGFTLARRILEKEFGEDWVGADYGDGKTWGEVLLTPSKIYHAGLLNILGRHGEERKLDVHGLVHVTGGGIDGNLSRIAGDLSFEGEFDLVKEPMRKLMEIGGVDADEAARTWNMGVGMLVIVGSEDEGEAMELLGAEGFEPVRLGVLS